MPAPPARPSLETSCLLSAALSPTARRPAHASSPAPAPRPAAQPRAEPSGPCPAGWRLGPGWEADASGKVLDTVLGSGRGGPRPGHGSPRVWPGGAPPKLVQSHVSKRAERGPRGGSAGLPPAHAGQLRASVRCGRRRRRLRAWEVTADEAAASACHTAAAGVMGRPGRAPRKLRGGLPCGEVRTLSVATPTSCASFVTPAFYFMGPTVLRDGLEAP